jgi:hypothetical protein
MSNPLAGSVRVTQQTARLSSLLTNIAPVPSGALYSSSLLQEASPTRRGYTDLGCQDTRRWLQKQTFVTPSAIFFVPGPTCRGPVPLCMPPSAIKGEACDVTNRSKLRLTQTPTSSYKLSSNTSHNEVGCYAPAARTTLNPCVFLCFYSASN